MFLNNAAKQQGGKFLFSLSKFWLNQVKKIKLADKAQQANLRIISKVQIKFSLSMITCKHGSPEPCAQAYASHAITFLAKKKKGPHK